MSRCLSSQGLQAARSFLGGDALRRSRHAQKLLVHSIRMRGRSTGKAWSRANRRLCMVQSSDPESCSDVIA